MVGFCCILLAASVGFFLSGPSVTQPSSSTAAYQFNLLKGKIPVGVSVPTTALIDVGFASSQDGFALAAHRGDVLLAASTDGGATWQVRNDDLPSGLGADDGYPGQFEFAGSAGYLWGARTTGGVPLWVSHDHGATWDCRPDRALRARRQRHRHQRVGPHQPVSAHRDITSATSCSMGVEQSSDEGATWTALSAPELTNTLPEGTGLRGVELARITTGRAYVLSGPANRSRHSPAVATVIHRRLGGYLGQSRAAL